MIEYIYIYKYIYTWNPNDPCFDWKIPCFGGAKAKHRGQTGSRCILILFFGNSTHQLVFSQASEKRLAQTSHIVDHPT